MIGLNITVNLLEELENMTVRNPFFNYKDHCLSDATRLEIIATFIRTKLVEEGEKNAQ